MIGLYTHIPFCNEKCPYCDFYSVAGDKMMKQRYVDAVLKELEDVYQANMVADTLYFGGGTPTLLEPAQLVQIVAKAKQLYHLDNAELTIEANPDTVNQQMLTTLHEGGINRISFGVQSGVDSELRSLGRKHSAEQAAQAVAWAKLAGFDNISVDLMLGIPNQTMDSIEQSLDLINRLKIQHVSAYMLKVEPNTPFYQNPITEFCPNDDITADIYLKTVKALQQMGFEQYEISNFSQYNKESRHNLKYWLCQEYLGIGASAHSFIKPIRYGHGRDIQRYIQQGKQDMQFMDNDAGNFDEYLMLGLRLTRGVDLSKAEQQYSFDKPALLHKISKFEKAGLMSIQQDVIALTVQGFLLSNSIISTLI